MANIIKNELGFPTFRNLVENFFENDWTDYGKKFPILGSTVPSANIKESETNYQIHLAAPGLKKEDFQIDLDNHVLTIFSEKKEEKTEEKETYTRREYNYSSFSRSFYVPESANKEKIEAEYKDGVLNIMIPKKDSAIQKPQRKIEVK